MCFGSMTTSARLGSDMPESGRGRDLGVERVGDDLGRPHLHLGGAEAAARALGEIAKPQLLDADRDVRIVAREDEPVGKSVVAVGADHADGGRPVGRGVDPGHEVAQQRFALRVGACRRGARRAQRAQLPWQAASSCCPLRSFGRVGRHRCFQTVGHGRRVRPQQAQDVGAGDGRVGIEADRERLRVLKEAFHGGGDLRLEGRVVSVSSRKGRAAESCCVYSSRVRPWRFASASRMRPASELSR